MERIIRLDNLLPTNDEQFNTEIYANQMRPDMAAKPRGTRGNQSTTKQGIKSLDVSHWAKNVPQSIRDDTT